MYHLCIILTWWHYVCNSPKLYSIKLSHTYYWTNISWWNIYNSSDCA